MNLGDKESKPSWEVQKVLNPASYTKAASGVSKGTMEVVVVTAKASSMGKALLVIGSWKIPERRSCKSGDDSRVAKMEITLEKSLEKFGDEKVGESGVSEQMQMKQMESLAGEGEFK